MTGGPYLSIVVTSRNDDHGGDMLRRMNIFVDGLVSQCRAFDIPAELIFVEWNPPGDRPGLIEALEWPADMGPVQARMIVVPPELHARHKYAHALPLYQMIAKNVGIRRAKGAFVMATNVDIIFSDALMRHIAARRLRRGSMYRVDRYDIKADVPTKAPHAERLAFCEDRANWLRICKRGGTDNLLDGSHDTIFPNHFGLWLRIQYARLFPRAASRRYKMSAQQAREFFEFHRAIGRLHTNACGDFTMLAREDWHRLRGYAEYEMYSFHIDSLFCHAAVASGVKEVFLNGPRRIFHLEHSSGSGYTPDAQDQLWERLERAKIPRMSDAELWDEVRALRSGRREPIFAPESWGLGAFELAEQTL
jgi:hypothetical protein